MIQFQTSNVYVFESALFRTTSTVIQTPDVLLVVDPTWLPNEIAEIQQFVQAIKGERPLYLLFTHSDYDHIIGYQAFPNAVVIASQAFIENPEKESILQQILKFDTDYYIQRSYAIEYPIVHKIVIKDEQKLQIGETILTFYLAPGHNSDGIFTIVTFENQCIWIAGDYLSNIEFPFIYHSSYDYENTLAKAILILQNEKIDLLIAGHGDVTTQKTEMNNRIEESYAYLHALRKALKTGEVFQTEQLWKRYLFRGIQQKYHEENVALMTKELNVM